MQRVVVEEEGEALDGAVEDVRIETGPPNGIIFALSDLLFLSHLYISFEKFWLSTEACSFKQFSVQTSFPTSSMGY